MRSQRVLQAKMPRSSMIFRFDLDEHKTRRADTRQEGQTQDKKGRHKTRRADTGVCPYGAMIFP